MQSPDHQITQSPDSRAPSAVGRVGRLDVIFERRGARTVAAHRYAEPPLRAGSTYETGDAASLILVCSGPGIFAGDTLRQSVHVRGGARVVLTSQSSLQVHPSDAEAPARIVHRYQVDDEAELHAVWDPVIPFAGARLEQRFEIDVAAGGRLFWSDALMAGRVSRGERWQFDRLAHELRLRVGGALVYLERYGISPAARGVQRAWVMDRHDYVGTTLVCHPGATGAVAERLQRSLDADTAVCAGVDALADGLLVARVASASGPAFARVRRELRRDLLAALFEGADLVDRK